MALKPIDVEERLRCCCLVPDPRGGGYTTRKPTAEDRAKAEKDYAADMARLESHPEEYGIVPFQVPQKDTALAELVGQAVGTAIAKAAEAARAREAQPELKQLNQKGR